MGTDGLYKAVKEGAPLVEITVCYSDGIDYMAATKAINDLSDELHLDEQSWYNDPKQRIGAATKEALELLFGWKLKRVPLEIVNEKTLKTEETKLYCWEGANEPQYYPKTIKGLIANIAYSQPGVDDNGQWYE